MSWEAKFGLATVGTALPAIVLQVLPGGCQMLVTLVTITPASIMMTAAPTIKTQMIIRSSFIQQYGLSKQSYSSLKHKYKGDILDMNKVLLRGNVSTNPKFLHEENPEQICSFFNIAVPDYSRKKDGGGYQADFIDCAAFKQNAVKIQKHIQIGAEIIIEGSWHTYIDPKTRVKKNQCLISKLEYISSKPISNSTSMAESGFL